MTNGCLIFVSFGACRKCTCISEGTNRPWKDLLPIPSDCAAVLCIHISTCSLLYVMTMYIFSTLKLRGIPLYSSVVSYWFIFQLWSTLCPLMFANVAERFDWSVGTLQQEPWLTCCWNPRQQPFWPPGISFMCSVDVERNSQSFLEIQLLPNSIGSCVSMFPTVVIC